MGEYNEESILEELEIFRWSLYNAKKEDAKEKEKLLLEEACRKTMYEPFIEEWIIAGCDMLMVNIFYLSGRRTGNLTKMADWLKT